MWLHLTISVNALCLVTMRPTCIDGKQVQADTQTDPIDSIVHEKGKQPTNVSQYLSDDNGSILPGYIFNSPPAEMPSVPIRSSQWSLMNSSNMEARLNGTPLIHNPYFVTAVTMTTKQTNMSEQVSLNKTMTPLERFNIEYMVS